MIAKIPMADKRSRNGERGSILLLTLMLLAILTILGVAATQSTWFEMKVANNDRFSREAFERADTGISLVIADPTILGDTNITTGSPQTKTDPDLPNFEAKVEYMGAETGGVSLRGSGYSAESFRAHTYDITSTGTAPQGARSTVSVGGYRIGF